MQFGLATLAASAVVSAVVALPAPELQASSATCKKLISHTATYDKQSAPVGVNLDRLSAPVLGLKYEGFAVQSDSLEVTGLKAQSAPNTVFYNAVTLIAGTNVPVIRTTLPDRAIELKSVYLGCSTNLHVVRVPTACTVTASGTQKGTNKIVTTTFSVPSDSSMTKFTFPASFGMVSQVSFNTASGPLGQLIAATSLDNLDYSLYKC